MIDIVELPSGWSIEKIEELCIFNPKHDKKIDNDIEVSFVPMATVDEHAGIIKSHERKPLGEVRKGYTHFADEDIIFAKITPCMENGKVAVARNLINGLACGSTEFHVLRSYGGILPNYLFYFLRQQSYLHMAAGNMTGVVGQRRLPKEFLLTTKVPIPPLNEQRRLVTKIESLKARTARVKDSLSTIPALLDQFRQSVLAAAFRGDLTADWREQNPDVEPVKKVLIKSNQEESNILPDTWNLATVGDVIESLKYGTSQKCGYESAGVPVLRIPNIGNGVIEHSDLKYADLPKKEFDELRLIPGDILIIRSNGSVSLVGKSALVKESDKDFAYAGYLIRLRLNQLLIYPNYLNLCLSSHDIRMQIEVPAKSTSGVHNINSQEVKRLKIPVAPLEEQKEIVRQIQLLFKAADIIEKQYQQTFGAIDQLDQSILAQAFRGALVPQDPNDEPASVLLERIRAEREKNTGATSKRSKKNTDTSPKQSEKNTGASSKRSNKSEPFKEAIQMELELE